MRFSEISVRGKPQSYMDCGPAIHGWIEIYTREKILHKFL